MYLARTQIVRPTVQVRFNKRNVEIYSLELSIFFFILVDFNSIYQRLDDATFFLIISLRIELFTIWFNTRIYAIVHICPLTGRNRFTAAFRILRYSDFLLSGKPHYRRATIFSLIQYMQNIGDRHFGLCTSLRCPTFRARITSLSSSI